MNLLLIVTKTNGEKVRSLLAFETDNEAVSRMYSELAYASAENSGVSKIVAALVTDELKITKYDKWGKEPTPAPESEVNE